MAYPPCEADLYFGERHPTFVSQPSGTRFECLRRKIDDLAGDARRGAIHKFCILTCQQKKSPDEKKILPERFASVHSPVDVVDKNVLSLEN
jgi:hypothetical protein